MRKIIALVTTCFCFLLLNSLSVEAKNNNNYNTITVKDGATYYESSENFGSGRSTLVNSGNIYTPNPCLAKINGYSFLDVNGNIIKSYYDSNISQLDIPNVPSNCSKVFVHFRTENYRNGWTDIENINSYYKPDISADSVDIIEDIKNEAAKSTVNEKTAIVIDCSGSMSDNQKAVVNQLGNITFNKNTKIYVFAQDLKTIEENELVNFEEKALTDYFGIGYGTLLVKSLSTIDADASIHKILLISDIEEVMYEDYMFSSSHVDELKIYDPDDTILDDQVMGVLEKCYPNALIERILIE